MDPTRGPQYKSHSKLGSNVCEVPPGGYLLEIESAGFHTYQTTIQVGTEPVASAGQQRKLCLNLWSHASVIWR